MGIKEEYMWIDIDPTHEQLKKSFLEIYKLENKLAAAGISFTLFVYCGGHGGTHDEKQVFLLNSNDNQKAHVPIEQKLERLVGGPLKEEKDSRVIAFYDCCRVSLRQEAFKPLQGRNYTSEEIEDLEMNELPNKYFHATACESGGVAEADGKYALKLC